VLLDPIAQMLLEKRGRMERGGAALRLLVGVVSFLMA
jgi:hypothetical protein